MIEYQLPCAPLFTIICFEAEGLCYPSSLQSKSRRPAANSSAFGRDHVSSCALSDKSTFAWTFFAAICIARRGAALKLKALKLEREATIIPSSRFRWSRCTSLVHLVHVQAWLSQANCACNVSMECTRRHWICIRYRQSDCAGNVGQT